MQKKKQLELIYFFGGSTMMSMGAVTPNFSIPSLVEKILKKISKRCYLCELWIRRYMLS